MKTIPLPIAAIFATALFAALATAEDKAPAEPKLPPVEPIPTVVMPIQTPTIPENPKWSVHVEVLMVALPQDMALDLLPELRDPARCEAAFTKILAAIKDKKAILMDYPMVETLDRNRAVSENMVEQRYPTEFTPSMWAETMADAASVAAKKAAPEKTDYSAFPTAFETRNIGATMEVEPAVSEKGDKITMQLSPQRVELLRFDSFYAKHADGKQDKYDQPQFASSRTTTTVTVRSGEHRLIGVHKLVKLEGFIELFILQAVATPVK